MQKKFKVTDIVDGKRAQQLINKYSSPLYVYSQNIIKHKIDTLLYATKGFKVSYALKANTNKTLVKLIKSFGIDHIDVVSPGEIHKAIQCGYQPKDIMYTQNFISDEEIDYALNLGVTLNIGAFETLYHYRQKLRGKRIFVRINPKLGAGTTYHVITGGPKSKFGIYQDKIDQLIKVAKEYDIHIVGVHQHIGSNLKKKDQEIFLQTLTYVASLLNRFQEIEQINIGGGLGVIYKEGEVVSDPQYLYSRVREIISQVQKKFGKPIKISIEPGRYIIADSGTLLCKITATKKTPQRSFYGTDTGFNHLIRPAFYGAFHQIVNLTNPDGQKELVCVCGNICECSDFLNDGIMLSGKIGDILGIENAGAYGFAMSSNYNERPKPAEILINSKGEDVLIRRKETFQDLEDKL